LAWLVSPLALGPRRLIKLQLERAGVAQVPEKLLVSSDYHWREAGGVIDIEPFQSADVMDTMVEQFHITHALQDDALDQLARTPEFRAALAGAGLRIRTIHSIAGQMPDVYLKRFSLSVRHTTVRDILNKMLLALRGDYWYFQRYGDHLQYATLYIA